MPLLSLPDAAAREGPTLRIAEIVAALSLAADLGTGQPMGSSLRACALAVRFGEALALAEEELGDVYHLALLRLAGCTADSHLAAAALGDEIAFSARASALDYGDPAVMMRFALGFAGAGLAPLPRGRAAAAALRFLMRDFGELAAGHCEVAQAIAGRLGMGKSIQEGLGQVFERWDGKGLPARLRGEAITRPVRIVQLAGDLEAAERVVGADGAAAVARQRAGGAFDPELARRFAAEAPQIFSALDQVATWDAVLALEPRPHPVLSGEALDLGPQVIADFVDLKSPFMAGHSRGVAELAAAAAAAYGLTTAETAVLRRAGYIHDLGRVGVSSGIWGKPGPLTDGEWERVRLHPYHTERVLSRSIPLSRLGAVASLHRERLDGSGYHRGLPGALLPPPARLLAAADAYRAMTELRPHRPALAPEEAAETLRGEVRAGRLDGEAGEAVLGAAGHRGRRSRPERIAGLTERELDVLGLLARGLTKRQVAKRLVVSVATVDHHARHIYSKIGVSTRAGAALFAMRHDLVGDVTDSSHGA